MMTRIPSSLCLIVTLMFTIGVVHSTAAEGGSPLGLSQLVTNHDYAGVTAYFKVHPEPLVSGLLRRENHPLLLAAEAGDRPMLKLLLAAGVPTYVFGVEDYDSGFVMEYVLSPGVLHDQELAVWLYENGYPIDATYHRDPSHFVRADDLQACIRTGAETVVEYLLQRGYDCTRTIEISKPIGVINYEIGSYLAFLARHATIDGHALSICRMLVERGVSVDSTELSLDGYSADRETRSDRLFFRVVYQKTVLDIMEDRGKNPPSNSLISQLTEYLISSGAHHFADLLSSRSFDGLVSVKATVTEDAVRLRAAPSLQAQIMDKLNKGPVSVVYTDFERGTTNIWHLVRTPQGRYGWMSGLYISVEREQGS